MSREIDVLTSFTLKHLRDRWWTPTWARWVQGHLDCGPGDRLAHVGCGNGEVDVALALATPGLSVVSLDCLWHRVAHTRDLGRDVGVPLYGVVGDLRALPLARHAFDAVVCLGVLQHLQRPSDAAHALARLVRPGGRLLILEPDHESRLWYSASDAGVRAFELARRHFARQHLAQAPETPPRLGLHVASWLREAGLDPLSIETIPVGETRLGAPPPGAWDVRERALAALHDVATDVAREEVGALWDAVRAYRADGEAQADAFVEVQHTLLIATLAQRPGEPAEA